MVTLLSGKILTVAAVTMLGITLPNLAFSRARLYGSHETKTLDCAGGSARIAGANNRVTLTGGCTHVTVLGSHNLITAEFAPGASIWFAGSRNEVIWTAHDGKEPRARHFGYRNTLKKGE